MELKAVQTCVDHYRTDIELSEVGFNAILNSRLSHPDTRITTPNGQDLLNKGFVPVCAWNEYTRDKYGNIDSESSCQLWESSLECGANVGL